MSEYVELVLPSPQLYIVVAILLAIAAIISADLRDEKAGLFDKKGVNRVALVLLAGSWIALLQIGIEMAAKIALHEISAWAIAGMAVHSIVLVMIGIVVTAWYWSIAVYKEIAAGLLPDPPTE